MSGELVSWLGGASATEVRHDRALERVQNHTDLAIARVTGIAQVAQTAMMGTLSVAMMKREASLLVVEDAAKFDLVATHAAIGMATVINRLAQQ